MQLTLGTNLFLFSACLLHRCIDSQSKPNLLEKILLLLGALMFFACGGLILASLEQVLPDLYDNAIILGGLSFFVGLLYLIDMADPLSRKTPTMTQTEERQIKSISAPVSTWPRTKITKDAQTATDSLPATPQLPRAAALSAPSLTINQDDIDFVATTSFPERQSPVFAKVKEPKLHKQKYIAKDYINPGFQEPWEELEQPVAAKPPSTNQLRGSISRASSRTPDFGYQSGSTYVPAPPVDRGNLQVIRKARPMMYTYYPEYSIDQTKQEVDEDESMQPMRRGYVANTARMWDGRLSSKSKSPVSLDTVV